MSMEHIEDLYGLSPMQQGLLFHTLYAPETGVYLIQFSCTLHGALHAEAFQHAWQRVIDRHPILRTAFIWEGTNEPLQVVLRQIDLPWEQHDWRGLRRETQEEQLFAHLQDERERGVALSEAPLMRFSLIRLADDVHAFVWSYHHLLLDGWSLSLVVQEVFAYYEAFRQERDISLPRPRPYRDYIAWLQQQDASAAEHFWRATLGGFTAPTRLPSDLAGHDFALQAAHIDEQQICLSATLTDTLQKLARTYQLTPNTLVQGAWAVLLSYYSGESDIVFGTTVSGRPADLSGVETMVGIFINTLPVRLRVSPKARLVDWLKEVRDQQAELRQYEYSSLAQIQAWSELPKGTPLFESLLVFENYPVEATAQETSERLEVRPLRAVEQTNYPLTIIVEPVSELRVRMSYDSTRFTAATIRRMLSHFQTLLEEIARNPECQIKDLSPLPPAERQQLLQDWNATAAPFAHDRCLHALFESFVQRTPNMPAVVFEQNALTYHELNERANQLAHHLRSLGVGPEVRVGVCVERSLDLVVGMLGIFKAGGAYVPLDPAYPQDRLAFMLQDSQVPVLLTQQKLLSRLSKVIVQPNRRQYPVVLSLDTDWDTIGKAATHNPESGVQPENLAYVIYTSGSTGKPKGTLVPHRGLCNVAATQQRMFATKPGDRVLQFASLSFDASIFELIMALGVGATVYLVSSEASLPGPALTEFLRDSAISIVTVTPSTLAAMPVEPLPHLRTVTVAGEACAGELAARWAPGRRFFNLYGPTETTIWASAAECFADTERPTIGHPIANTQIYLLDRYLRPVPVGVPGELAIGGVGVARGYLNRPDLTAERFVPDPFLGQPGARLYRTGDLARYRADGSIEFLGRIDQQVKMRGFRIELGEIEAALKEHPSLQDAVVLAREDRPGHKQLVAYVVMGQQGDALSPPPDLRAFLKQTLPDYMIPGAFVPLETLPLTPNGKIDRRALPAPDQLGLGLEDSFVAPRTPEEELLVGIWSQILHVQRVGIHDNFFALGGHSLLATQLIARVREVFQVDLPLRSLFDAPTIAELCEQIVYARQIERDLSMPLLVPAAREQVLPLSFAQQRLWLLDRLDPDSPAYNIPTGVYLTGQLHTSALEHSLNEILRRHEALRTTFALVDGQPAQTVHQDMPFTIDVVDLRSFLPSQRNDEVQRLACAEAQRPFDLVAGPLLRATLLQLEEQEHVLLLVMHHIVSDAWSVEVFIRELAALYHASINGQPAQLPTLPIQYVDFAIWQREWLQGQMLETQLAYWRQRLGDAAPVLALPTDYPRPAVQTFNGRKYITSLPKPLSDALAAFSRREGVTLYMTLLAAFQIILYRYSGQYDISVGTPIAGRTRRELEDLIGFFVNTLVLRADLSGNPTVREFLEQVREVCLGAYAHQDLPFEYLVEELQPERDLSRQPLFQVMFALQNAPLEEVSLSGLTLRPLNIDNNTAKFDLTLVLGEGPDGLITTIEYNTDLFAPPTIHQMAQHFQRVLEGMVADPDLGVADLPILSAAERRGVLVDWNASAVAHPLDRCFHELFEAQVVRTPQALAAVYVDQRLTYDQLNRRANRLAWQLVERGIGQDVVVGLLAERSIDFLTAVLAIFKAGGAYLPLDPRHPANRHRQVLAQSNVLLILATEEFLPVLADVQMSLDESNRPQVEQLELLLERHAAETNLPLRCSPESLAYTIFTSGSTGLPKGAMVEQKGMLNHLFAKISALGLTETDSLAQTASQCFDISVWQFLAALLVGGYVHIFGDEIAHNPARLLEQVDQHAITILETVPSLLRATLDEIERRGDKRPALAALRWMVPTGEALSPEICRAWLGYYPGIPLMNAYGPTECSDDVTHFVIEQCPTEDTVRMPIGYPVDNMRLYVLDPRLQPVPVGVIGELYVGGVGVGRGYLNDPRRTAEIFIPDPFAHDPGQRLYKTGDLARHLRDGSIDFLGRIDHQVKIRGFRIELGEIEAALSQHPAVHDTVVLAREDEPGNQRLVAYVVPDMGYQEEEAPQIAVDRDVRQAGHWQMIFDEIYAQKTVSEEDAGINLRVWISSYTGEAFPEAEIFECVNDTVDRIRALKPQRVLELGCGTGLLLFRIAPYCTEYVGTDISQEALMGIEQRMQGRDLSGVTLLHRAADDLSGIPSAHFDVVVINEVVQYFPSVDYLVRVLENAVQMVRPGGCIFVGDVRSFPLMEAFHASVQLFQADDALDVTQLRQRIQKHLSQEKELLVDPAFFMALQQHLPQIDGVRLQIKGGAHHNEFTRFRYDAILQVHASTPQLECDWLDWRGQRVSDIQRLLEDTRPAAIGIRGVPNARLQEEVALLRLLAEDEHSSTVADLRKELHSRVAGSIAIEPEELFSLGSALSYDVNIFWADDTASGCFDVVFHRKMVESTTTGTLPTPYRPVAIQPWHTYANTPLRNTVTDKLLAQLRLFLNERLPEYMVPTAYVILESIPLTPNGKVDRKALPAPERRSELAGDFMPPRSPLEEALAEIWSEVLNIERIGVNDNFFTLGGHSLLGTQVISRVYEAFQVELPLRRIFETPTIAGLAEAITQLKIEEDNSSDIAHLLDQLEHMSEEEALQALGDIKV